MTTIEAPQPAELAAGDFIATAIRVSVSRPGATCWQRWIDWAWPPIVRYGRRAIFRLTINGAPVMVVPLVMTAPRNGVGFMSFYRPVQILRRDVFQVAIDFRRGVPATLCVTTYLDGFLLKKRS